MSWQRFLVRWPKRLTNQEVDRINKEFETLRRKNLLNAASKLPVVFRGPYVLLHTILNRPAKTLR